MSEYLRFVLDGLKDVDQRYLDGDRFVEKVERGKESWQRSWRANRSCSVSWKRSTTFEEDKVAQRSIRFA